ncbi:hypothetical protein [Streptomyces blastmyceticus]|uniref:Uncharacterized protein n=1 Tax=Streptomyces blastmyceticus TaxID=68180 RepID=A0ABN0XSQ7_9ACTN
MAAVPLDLLDRIRELERQVRELAGRSQIRPAMDQVSKGNVKIGEGGSFGVFAPTGAQILGVGFWGNGEYGVSLKRQDGTAAMTVRNGTTDGQAQPLRLFDSRGHEIWADDVATGGIAYPWLTLVPPQDAAPIRWPQTNSGSFTLVAQSFNPVYQPKIRLYCHTIADNGTAGEVRVKVNDRIWGPAITAGSEFDHTDFTCAEIGSVVEVAIEARRTSGTGSVYVQPKMLYGRQT